MHPRTDSCCLFCLVPQTMGTEFVFFRHSGSCKVIQKRFMLAPATTNYNAFKNTPAKMSSLASQGALKTHLVQILFLIPPSSRRRLLHLCRQFFSLLVSAHTRRCPRLSPGSLPDPPWAKRTGQSNPGLVYKEEKAGGGSEKCLFTKQTTPF